MEEYLPKMLKCIFALCELLCEHYSVCGGVFLCCKACCACEEVFSSSARCTFHEYSVPVNSMMVLWLVGEFLSDNGILKHLSFKSKMAK